MLHDPSLRDRVADLNARYQHHSAVSVMEHALREPLLGRLAMVSSFGAESVVLLHMISLIARDTPVLFLDTEMLFAETLEYQKELSARLMLQDVRLIRATRAALFEHDNEGLLHLHDPDACCNLRKSEPLQEALEGFDGWITGRKRYQGGQRLDLQFFEADGVRRIKVNPLAHWNSTDLQDYIVENRLPRHPLVAQGYPSIGCAPCTTRVGDGEDARAGRWRDNDKEECGIHFENGRLVRSASAA